MKVRFEELSYSRRIGGVEAATQGLVANLLRHGVEVTRSSQPVHSVRPGMPDCVHIHGIWSPRLAKQCFFWKACGVRCVLTPHGMLEPWALAHKRLKKRLAWHLYQRKVLNSVSALHATSAREAANFSRLGLKAPVEIIPWGIDLPEYVPKRHKPRTNQSPRTAVFVGRLYPVKGLPMLVQAWAKVRPPGWRMRIVGPDEAGHRSKVQALVRSLGLEDAFEFSGPLHGQDLQVAYDDADLFVLPSHTENFGFVVGEALSHRLAVVVTHGAPWEGIAEHKCGWWTPASVDGIATALSAATKLDRASLTEMGESGRAWIASDFSWHSTAERMTELYKNVLSGVAIGSPR